MKLHSSIKKAIAKWPLLLLLLAMPALVFAQQQDDKDKKKNPPPPPPKKSESTPPPKQAPPQNTPPPQHNPPPPQQHNPPPPERHDTPDKTPPQGGQPSNTGKPTGQPVQPSQGGQQGQGGQRGGQPTGQPTGQPGQGGQQGQGGQRGGQPTGQPTGQPGQGGQQGQGGQRGGQPTGQPTGQPVQGGQQGQGGQRGQQPMRPTGQPLEQPGQRDQRGGQPAGQPTGGQPGQGNQRNRERDNRPVPAPVQVKIHAGNATVIRGPVGSNVHVTTIRTDRGVTINHTDYGRRVQTVRPGGVVVVSIGNSRGFVQRPLARVGFVQRTYVVRGRPYVRVYRNYNYRGIAYVRYVPAYYYSPRFYIWAYNPWARPVYWGWGWGIRTPWFYGGYFAPAPFYVSASLWLTDYIIAENLRASYEAQMEAEGQNYAPPPPDYSTQADPNAYNNAEISPALRQAIADEVQRQLDAERNAANNPQQSDNSSSDQAPPALAADQRVFVVSAPLQVYDGDQPCSLTQGDIVSRIDDNPGDDGAVGVSVLTSKSADCRPGAQPRIQVADLEDMANDLRAQTDEGLKNLSQNQGKNGMPPAPDVTQRPNPNGQGTPDPDAVNQLNQQRQDADQTEKEVGGPGGGNVMLMPAPISPTPQPVTQLSGKFATLQPTIDSRPDLHLQRVRLIPDLVPDESLFPASPPDLAARLSKPPRDKIYFSSRTF
jgi:hypothetical protein